MISVVAVIVALSCPSAFARGDDRRGDDRRGRVENNRRDDRGHNRGNRHYYRDGRWHTRGWFGWDTVVSALVVGAFIESLPPQHTTVVVEGRPYYHDDRYYYQQTQGGYIVVQEPVMVRR